MEEHEAVKEELKSAHEEVLSANEEFQSTNEELETAKEELQSANEELTTTNDELRNRNRELGRAERRDREGARVCPSARWRTPTSIIETRARAIAGARAPTSRSCGRTAPSTTDFKVRCEDTEGRFLLDQLGDG